MNKENSKRKTSFSISQDIDNLLDLLAKNDSRSSASMLEVLVKEAALKRGTGNDFVPTETDIIELGFTKHAQISSQITRFEKIHPCPNGSETLVIEISRGGSVFFIRLASKHTELWGGWRLPSRQFFYELLDSFGWL